MEVPRVVPQLFFDLIGRVIPGSVALFTWSIASGRDLGWVLAAPLQGATTLQQSTFALLVAFFLASYIVGHLLAPVSSILETRLWVRLLPSYFDVLIRTLSTTITGYSTEVQELLSKELQIDAEKTIDKDQRMRCKQALFIWYDAIRMQDREPGIRITKSRAESTMFGCFLIAFGGALPMHFVYTAIERQQVNWPLVILMILSLSASFLGLARTYRNFQLAVINHYYLLKVVVRGSRKEMDRGEEREAI